MITKKNILDFCKKHRSECACLCAGIGIGAYALYRHYFGSVCSDKSTIIFPVCGKDHETVAKTIIDWWSASADKPVVDGMCGFQSPVAAINDIDSWFTNNADKCESVSFLIYGLK